MQRDVLTGYMGLGICVGWGCCQASSYDKHPGISIPGGGGSRGDKRRRAEEGRRVREVGLPWGGEESRRRSGGLNTVGVGYKLMHSVSANAACCTRSSARGICILESWLTWAQERLCVGMRSRERCCCSSELEVAGPDSANSAGSVNSAVGVELKRGLI